MNQRSYLTFFASLIICLTGLSSAVSASVTTTDFEHLPVANLQAELIRNGLTPTTAAQMLAALTKKALAVGMPLDVLFGALDQESHFINYGLNFDYGNYSCGMAQSNISLWCAVASATVASRNQYAWPDGVDCGDLQNLNAQIMGPMLNGAKTLRPLTALGALATDFQRLDPRILIAQMPASGASSPQAYYQAAMSFVNNCSKTDEGVEIGASGLRAVYDQYVPKELKSAAPHTAWVLADAMYNIGPVLVPILEQNGGEHVWQTLTPQLIIDIESRIMNTGDGSITLTNADGESQSVSRFRLCVNQRHIQYIMRDTLPAATASVIHASTETCNP